MIDNMAITSAQYMGENNINFSIKAVIDGIEKVVPLDPANRHFAEIVRRVEAGTLTIEDAD